MTIAIQINTDGLVKDLEDLSLEALQSAVGGWVQYVQVLDGLLMWVNEEGKMDGLPHNKHAQRFWDATYEAGTDLIMGNVVFTGDADARGETLPLTEAQADKVRMLAYTGSLEGVK